LRGVSAAHLKADNQDAGAFQKIAAMESRQSVAGHYAFSFA
jgi:hypothetical protein